MGTDQGHYFSADPHGASAPQRVTVRARGTEITLHTDTGVFSKDRLDPGTKVLLDLAPPPEAEGALLDLGCGYGPIAATLAAAHPDRPVWAVDVNTRALELVRRNATALGLDNLRACLPDEVPVAQRFGGIYSNPPIRIGKAELHALLVRWLGTLSHDGAAYLVVQRNLGADSLASWLGTQGFPIERLGSRRGYRVLRADRARG